jgi:hypothetical protein
MVPGTIDCPELLLGSGADPLLLTCIDNCETAREMAEHAGHDGIARLLASYELGETKGSED